MFDDEYEYDDFNEPDPDEMEASYQYNQIRNHYLEAFRSEPLSKKTIHLLTECFAKLKGLPFEPTSIKKTFISDVVYMMESEQYVKKFLTEVFLYKFKGLKLKEEPAEFLKVLYEKDTFELAKTFYYRNHYLFIMKFIYEVVQRAEKEHSTATPTSSRAQASANEDNGYEYSDVLYWEAVHEGDIIPDDTDFWEESQHDFDGDDFDDAYDFDDRADYSDPERIAMSLQSYITLLEEDKDNAIPLQEKKIFLQTFEKHVFEAKSLLKSFQVTEQIDRVFPALVQLGKNAGVTAEISSAYNKTVNFRQNEDNVYLQITLSHLVNDKEDWLGNEFSLRMDNIKDNVTKLDLLFVQTVMQAVGYDVNDQYVIFIQEVLQKDDSFRENTYTFPSGLKLSVIDHGNELRQFLKWKDI